MSMARTRRRAQDATPMRLLYSARTEADILYSDDLRAMAGAADGFELAITLTHTSAEDWPGLRGLVDRAKLREHGLAALDHPIAYVCGPTAFVEFVASELSAAGMPDAQIKTERFGPSGAPQ
jgi:ferredoxin-NADP reductase